MFCRGDYVITFTCTKDDAPSFINKDDQGLVSISNSKSCLGSQKFVLFCINAYVNLQQSPSVAIELSYFRVLLVAIIQSFITHFWGNIYNCFTIHREKTTLMRLLKYPNKINMLVEYADIGLIFASGWYPIRQSQLSGNKTNCRTQYKKWWPKHRISTLHYVSVKDNKIRELGFLWAYTYLSSLCCYCICSIIYLQQKKALFIN